MTTITAPTDGDVLSRDAVSLGASIAAREITSEAVTQAFLDRIAEVDSETSAFYHVATDTALAQARAVDAKVAAGEKLSPIAGVPVAIKDILCTKGIPTTCGSKILQGWVPPYDATVVANLKNAGAIILGKTAMDEFAMGSSGEWSAYGIPKNPWDTTRAPGGSGGGSAAAVAAFEAPIALGSDTGGSIRQPASFTGTVGVKPTYGAVSRYGAIAMASSLDQVGPCANTVADCAALQQVIGGADGHDATALDHDWSDLLDAARTGELQGVRIGVVTELGGDGYEPGVTAAFTRTLDLLTNAGAEIKEVSCPNFRHALAAYYLIMPSEASSNLARFDAMRYGLRVSPDTDSAEGANAAQVMAATRDAGFGPEVKRRIILGTYALSAGYYDAFYGKAQQVRTLVQRDFAAAFDAVDVLVSPTTPTTPFKMGDKLSDPVAMYLSDVATIPANLAGVPGMSLPCGLSDDDGLPVGFQILAPAREDARLYRIGGALERALHDQWGGPLATLMGTKGA